MGGCPKRPLERSRKMADGKSAFLGERRQFNFTIEVLVNQLNNSALLPRRQTAFRTRKRLASMTVLPDQVRANRQSEIIHEQLREHFRRLFKHGRIDCVVIDSRIGCWSRAMKTSNFGHSSIVRQRIQSGTRNVVVNPVDRTRFRILEFDSKSHIATPPTGHAPVLVYFPSVQSSHSPLLAGFR